MLIIDGWFFFYAALLILVIPIPWLFAAAFAAAVHELCHIAAIVLMGERIQRMILRPFGISIEVTFSSSGKELAAAIAGPAGSLSMLLLCHIWPHAALCALIQGIFNLLPVYPLDGGRVLCCLQELLRSFFLRKIPCKERPNRVQ